MAYSVEYDPDAQLVRVRIEGQYGSNEARGLLHETAKAVSDHDCMLMLVDMREAHPTLSVADLYDAPALIIEEFARFGVSALALKRAIVVNEKSPDIRFLEDVVTNRGQSLAVFTDFAEAVEWLRNP